MASRRMRKQCASSRLQTGRETRHLDHASRRRGQNTAPNMTKEFQQLPATSVTVNSSASSAHAPLRHKPYHLPQPRRLTTQHSADARTRPCRVRRARGLLTPCPRPCLCCKPVAWHSRLATLCLQACRPVVRPDGSRAAGGPGHWPALCLQVCCLAVGPDGSRAAGGQRHLSNCAPLRVACTLAVQRGSVARHAVPDHYDALVRVCPLAQLQLQLAHEVRWAVHHSSNRQLKFERRSPRRNKLVHRRRRAGCRGVLGTRWLTVGSARLRGDRAAAGHGSAARRQRDARRIHKSQRDRLHHGQRAFLAMLAVHAHTQAPGCPGGAARWCTNAVRNNCSVVTLVRRHSEPKIPHEQRHAEVDAGAHNGMRLPVAGRLLQIHDDELAAGAAGDERKFVGRRNLQARPKHQVDRLRPHAHAHTHTRTRADVRVREAR
eukprot:359079-Chlamydomonas_euryale.AAC.4